MILEGEYKGRKALNARTGEIFNLITDISFDANHNDYMGFEYDPVKKQSTGCWTIGTAFDVLKYIKSHKLIKIK